MTCPVVVAIELQRCARWRRDVQSSAARLILAFAIGLGVSATTPAPAAIHAPAAQMELANDGLYLLTFDEAPLAIYRGGVVDANSNRVLAATTPSITGAHKLDAHSIESKQYLGFLRDRRSTHLQDASALIGRPLAAKFVYDVLRNGVAVELSPAEAEQLRHLRGVDSVVADYRRQVTTDVGPQWIHADKIWDGTATSPAPGTRGAGIVIGVIDTGVNRTHPAFSGAGAINSRGRFYGLCASNATLCTNKLIGIYDFTTGGPPNDMEPNDGSDKQGHGSHAASTAAGAPVDYSILLPAGAQVRHAQGVASAANLITYKACESTAGCNGTWLDAALQQAATDGVDVISLSVGGGRGDPWSANETDTQDMLNARAAGIVVVVAAGNGGPSPGSLSAPGNAPWVLSVAAATHDRIFAAKLDLVGGATAPPNGGQLIGAAMTGGIGPLPIVRANPVQCAEGSNTSGSSGENKPAAWTSNTYGNMLVVCDRGIYPRAAKSKNVQLAGGSMVLINQARDGENTVADTHAIASTHLGYADGQALLAWLSTGSGQMGTLEGTVITTLNSQGDLLATFSGRGPTSTRAGMLKPDVTAPGVDILAASNIGRGFNIYSGTSMATAHAAGSAALLKAAHPSWGPSEIISALTTTARPSVRIDNTHLGTPFDQGAGMLDLAKAARAGLSLDVSTASFRSSDPAHGGTPHDLNLPSLVHDSCFEQCTLSRSVRDLIGGGTWQVSVNVPGAVITPDTTRFTLGSNATRTIHFAIDVRNAASAGHWLFGTVTLHPTMGTQIPDTVLQVAIFASPGSVQPPVVLSVPSESGFSLIDISGLVALPDASFAGTPLVPVVTQSTTVAQDPSPTLPFDNLSLGVMHTTFTVPEAPDHSARTYKVTVHATADVSVSNIDLYVGQDANGNGLPEQGETTCTSAGSSADETCAFDVINPGGGSGPIAYWTLAQNVSGPSGTLNIETVVVPIVADNTTLTATGPGQLPALATAKLRLIWNDPSMVTGSSRAGYAIVSATPGSQTTLIPVRLNRTGATAAAYALQNSVAHSVTLAPNTAQDRIFFDVPPNATQVVFNIAGTGQVDLYAAHVPYPATSDPLIPPAPARNLAQAKSTTSGGNETITLTGTAVLPGRWYVTPVNTSTSGAPVASIVTATVTAGTAPVPFVGTAFYDLNRSGSGIYINPDQNGFPELDWYAYQEDGTPTWYLADLNRVVDTGNAGQIWGDLQRVTMGTNGKVLTKVGTISISLVDATHLVYNYNLNGESGSSPMVRLGTHTCPVLSGSSSTTTGLWYPPAHDGIGQSLIVNNHDEYYAIYVYDATGNPRWAYAETPLASPPNAVAARTLTAMQLMGSCPQCTWAASTSADIGTFTRNLVQGGIGSIGFNFSFVSPLAGAWNETHPVIRISTAYACPPTFSISGTVTITGGTTPLAGVVMSLADGTTAVTDASGNYIFSNLSNASYTVTPTRAGYSFAPTTRTVNVSGANVTGQNFSATQVGCPVVTGTRSTTVFPGNGPFSFSATSPDGQYSLGGFLGTTGGSTTVTGFGTAVIATVGPVCGVGGITSIPTTGYQTSMNLQQGIGYVSQLGDGSYIRFYIASITSGPAINIQYEYPATICPTNARAVFTGRSYTFNGITSSTGSQNDTGTMNNFAFVGCNGIATVKAWGAGGAGGQPTISFSGGNGGGGAGGGGYGSKDFTMVPGQWYVVSTGVGGSYGFPVPIGTGGSSGFGPEAGAMLLTSTGGLQGTDAGGGSMAGTGGAGGGSNGTTTSAGGQGSNGQSNFNNTLCGGSGAIGPGGAGGSSGGAGGLGGCTPGAPSPPGGGGSGGSQNGQGTSGASGGVQIDW